MMVQCNFRLIQVCEFFDPEAAVTIVGEFLETAKILIVIQQTIGIILIHSSFQIWRKRGKTNQSANSNGHL